MLNFIREIRIENFLVVLYYRLLESARKSLASHFFRKKFDI
ncbi:MAG: hypothetical protein MAG581_00517 [Deltaproteobacteria bacterium]|nr:hypothetical protein [Deltaproteobacteria bacterium]